MKTSLVLLLCVTSLMALGNAKTIQDTQKVLKYDATSPSARQFSANEEIAHKKQLHREKREEEDEISDMPDRDRNAGQNGKFLNKEQRKSRGLASLTEKVATGNPKPKENSAKVSEEKLTNKNM